ncbi:MAG TPA: glycosyltransferase [Longimicrobiaceae bacterium]|jgi:glycosyltransferase involved in cell wall biosynthesis
MKILITVHQFLPEFSTGTEVIALGIARELRARGHRVLVVTGFPDARRLPDAERFDRYEYDGIPVERFRHSPHPMGAQRAVTEMAYDNRLFAEEFGAVLARFAPDLVHFVHLARLSASLVGPCVERGIPTVFTATDFWAVCPFSQLRLPDQSICAGPGPGALNCVRHLVAGSGARRASVLGLARHAPDWMLGLGVRAAEMRLPLAPPVLDEVAALARRQGFVREQLGRVDRVLAPSRLMERTLAAGGIAPGRVSFLPYGIDTAGIERRTDRGSGPALRLGFVGSLTEHKGLDVAVGAVRRLPPELPVELAVHGAPADGPAGRAYLDAVRSLAGGDPRIRFHGPFRNREVGGVLAGLDALVVPSVWHENTPLVVYEAFAAGCPVVASDVEGIAEVVRHGVDGLLFARGDADALARALLRLAEDRALVAALAGQTRPPLAVGEHVDRLESVYAELLAGRAARRRTPPRAGDRPAAEIRAS